MALIALALFGLLIELQFAVLHSSSLSCMLVSRLTKNSAEVQAAAEAVRVGGGQGLAKILVLTDSQFLVNCAGWIPGWKVRRW